MSSTASQQDAGEHNASQQAESDPEDAEDHSSTGTREAPLQAKVHNHAKVRQIYDCEDCMYVDDWFASAWLSTWHAWTEGNYRKLHEMSYHNYTG